MLLDMSRKDMYSFLDHLQRKEKGPVVRNLRNLSEVYKTDRKVLVFFSKNGTEYLLHVLDGRIVEVGFGTPAWFKNKQLKEIKDFLVRKKFKIGKISVI